MVLGAERLEAGAISPGVADCSRTYCRDCEGGPSCRRRSWRPPQPSRRPPDTAVKRNIPRPDPGPSTSSESHSGQLGRRSAFRCGRSRRRLGAMDAARRGVCGSDIQTRRPPFLQGPVERWHEDVGTGRRIDGSPIWPTPGRLRRETKKRPFFSMPVYPRRLSRDVVGALPP